VDTGSAATDWWTIIVAVIPCFQCYSDGVFSGCAYSASVRACAVQHSSLTGRVIVLTIGVCSLLSTTFYQELLLTSLIVEPHSQPVFANVIAQMIERYNYKVYVPCQIYPCVQPHPASTTIIQGYAALLSSRL
jgi:hypothetical protein